MFAPTTTFITETDPVGEITLTMECAYIFFVLQIVTLTVLVNFVCTNLLTLSLCKKKNVFFRKCISRLISLPVVNL
jgi:hypothetical protein